MPLNVGAAPSFPGEAQTRGCTTVITVALLFVVYGSAGVVPESAGEFVRVEAVPELVPVMVIVAVPPLAIAPSEQVTVVVPEQETVEGVATTEDSVKPVGSASVRVEAVVADGP